MKNKILFYLLLPAMLLVLQSCNSAPGYDDNPTQGNITIASDETLKLLIDTELDVFHATYQYAKITPIYKPEQDAVQLLMEDKARLVILPRELSPEEKKYFEQVQIVIKPVKFAVDAIALITNLQNTNKNFDYEKLVALLEGKITKWNQLQDNSSMGAQTVDLIFDNKNSSIFRYMEELTKDKKIKNVNLYDAKNSANVVEYVSKNPNSLGFIGVNWVSDTDDSLSNSFDKKINIGKVAHPDTSVHAGSYCSPFQAFIADGSYPLTRNIYIIRREAHSGLGTGFEAFLASEKGQRIVLNSGLLPATMPVRIIQVKNQGVTIVK